MSTGTGAGACRRALSGARGRIGVLGAMAAGGMAYAGLSAAAPTAKVVLTFREASGDDAFAGLLERGRAYFTAFAEGGQRGCEVYNRAVRCGTVARLLPPDQQHSAWREKVLHRFQPSPDGFYPLDSPVADKQGNLFLTTAAGGQTDQGALVELSPPLPGSSAWTETVIHSFGSDGVQPSTRPHLDAAGNLFVTTEYGPDNSGSYGSVLEFSPRADGQAGWTETVVHNFTDQGGDGVFPVSGLRADAQGNLFLTTAAGGLEGNGAAIELSPPSGGGTSWSETVIYSFEGLDDGDLPDSGLIPDAHGNLYGTTDLGGSRNLGAVYELSPSGGGGTQWTETPLYSFDGTNGSDPGRGLVIDAAGNLFVTARSGGLDGYGTLIELSPPPSGQTTWTETTLYRFPGGAGGSNPSAITVDDNGNLLVTTLNGVSYGNGVLVQISGTGYVKR